jgi:phage repressor protein C with HTH and peptisase S24 domain
MVDMGTLAERLREARRDKKAKQEDLARVAGVSKQAISKIENGGTLEPAMSTMEPIARLLGVSVRWLTEGRAPKHVDEAPAEEGWADIIGVRQAAALGDGAVADEYAETHKLKFRAESLRRKRLKADKLAVLYGKGESMVPTIKDGDAILFDTSDVEPRDDKIYVISYDGALMAKRLTDLGGRWFIKSDNTDDPKWRKPVPVDETKHFEIHGRVRWIGSWED